MATTVKIRAEEAVMRYSEDTVLWLKDKTGKDADPWQRVAIMEIEQNPRTLLCWPPRFGKTWAMEAVCMKELACNPYEREMLFGPIQKQGNNALREHLDWIETSEILSAWIAHRRGKRQISESKYEFQNHSQAETFGIQSNFDSENATILRGEEWDDMNVDVWTNRVLARGGRKNRSGLPTRIRLSGTIQYGKGPMFAYANDESYHTVSQFDIYDGIAFGIYDQTMIAELRDKLTDDQWLRIYMLKFTDTKNFIWETSIRECLQEAMRIGWTGVEYNPAAPYQPRGTVYMGVDMGHSGTGKTHSVYRMDIIEVLGDTVLWLYGNEWESTTDPEIVASEIVQFWQHYGVTAGYGDALKANDISMMNDMLYDRGLITVDRSDSPENKASDWRKWAFAPQWNTAKAKYMWGSATKVKIDTKKLIIPYFDRNDDRPIATMAKRLVQALLNVRMVVNNSSYPSLEIIKDEIGDDPFDAINMAIGCANDRQFTPVDLGLLGVQGNATVTSGIHTSVARTLERSRGDFSDFI